MVYFTIFDKGFAQDGWR